MEVKTIPKQQYQEAINIYKECFNKQEEIKITLPLTGELIGLYINEELIGLIQLDYINNLFENQKIAYINSFCIKKEHQNKGYGDFFLKKCINYLKEKNINKINLTSNKNRVYAHMLYNKNNFNQIDTIVLSKDIN